MCIKGTGVSGANTCGIGVQEGGSINVMQRSEQSGLEGLYGSAVSGVMTSPLTSMQSTILPPSGTDTANMSASVS